MRGRPSLMRPRRIAELLQLRLVQGAAEMSDDGRQFGGQDGVQIAGFRPVGQTVQARLELAYILFLFSNNQYLNDLPPRVPSIRMHSYPYLLPLTSSPSSSLILFLFPHHLLLLPSSYLNALPPRVPSIRTHSYPLLSSSSLIFPHLLLPSSSSSLFFFFPHLTCMLCRPECLA